MATKTDIANMAISHLGIGKTISALDSDVTPEAVACRLFYDTARDAILEWAAWPFAKKQVALGLVTEDPDATWSYSYQYPSDCIRFIRIAPATTQESAYDQMIPYRKMYGASGAEIWTNEEDAVGEYVRSVDEPTRYSANFINALALLLATYIAPRITGGDNFNLAGRSAQLYQVVLGQAASHAFNEEKRQKPPESEFIRARL